MVSRVVTVSRVSVMVSFRVVVRFSAGIATYILRND